MKRNNIIDKYFARLSQKEIDRAKWKVDWQFAIINEVATEEAIQLSGAMVNDVIASEFNPDYFLDYSLDYSE
jgi:uncharacterized membrane protein